MWFACAILMNDYGLHVIVESMTFMSVCFLIHAVSKCQEFES